VYRDFFAAPDFFFAPVILSERSESKDFFIPGKRKERRVRNGIGEISGDELPNRDKVPVVSFCDIILASPLFIISGSGVLNLNPVGIARVDSRLRGNDDCYAPFVLQLHPARPPLCIFHPEAGLCRVRVFPITL
jgi:hypothetical protein